MTTNDRSLALVGGAIGLAITGYALIYAPMKRNHDECGKVALCPQPITENDPEFWRRAMCTQPKYQHLEVCKP